VEASTVATEISSDRKVVRWFSITTLHYGDIANSLLGLLGMFKALETSFVAASKTVLNLSLSALFLEAGRFF
jgi:hypothetical protein